MIDDRNALSQALGGSPQGFIDHWLAQASVDGPASRTAAADANQLLSALRDAIDAGADLASQRDARWDAVHAFLSALSRSRAAQGATAGDMSRFVLSLKKPLFEGLRRVCATDPQRAFDVALVASELVDTLAQFAVSSYQRSREEVIARQQQELLELSTPVIKLWKGVLAVPMIGTLDSGRTQHVMEALLVRLVETGAAFAIIDITGVPTVDTQVAQHLLKTVAAIRLMGAECIVSGIRPQIAQTIVHLGIDLQGVITKATLADALQLALKRTGFTFSHANA